MIFLSPHSSTIKNVPAELTSKNGSAVYVSEESNAIYNDNLQPAEVPNADTPEPTIRHPEFFFDNTLIAIKIENTLFNVHKYQLAKSDFFSELFKLSRPKGDKPEEGSSPEHPIVIHGARASDFAALLRVLYASLFSSNQPTPEAPLIISAFRLANLLSFAELRAFLLPLAEKNLDDVDKIVFAREFDIKEWLAPAHTRLCKRDTVLSSEEANKLGVSSVLLIWRVREKYRGQSSGIQGGTYCSVCIKGVGPSSNPCLHCGGHSSNYLYSIGGATTGTQPNTNASGLEAEVEKWVEDDYVAKRS